MKRMLSSRGVFGRCLVALALVSLSLHLFGAFRVCLCERDPDRCGRECHTCCDEGACAAPDADSDCALVADECCNHLVLEAGDISGSDTQVRLSASCVLATCEAAGRSISRAECLLRGSRRMTDPPRDIPNAPAVFRRLNPLS